MDRQRQRGKKKKKEPKRPRENEHGYENYFHFAGLRLFYFVQHFDLNWAPAGPRKKLGAQMLWGHRDVRSIFTDAGTQVPILRRAYAKCSPLNFPRPADPLAEVRIKRPTFSAPDDRPITLVGPSFPFPLCLSLIYPSADEAAKEAKKPPT